MVSIIIQPHTVGDKTTVFFERLMIMSNMNDMSNMGSTDNIDNPKCADEANEVKEQSEKDNGGEKSKPNTLGEKIRKLRKAEGLTQEDLAWECGLSTVSLGKIERGVTTPRMATVRKLEEALGLLQGSLMTDYQTTDDENDALYRISAILMNGDLTENQFKKMVKIVELLMELVNDWE